MSFVRRRPVLAFWLLAVGLELLLIPLFLLTDADAAIARGLTAAGLTFNTDLVTAGRLVLAAPAAAPGVLLSLAQVASPDLALLVVVMVLGRAHVRAVVNRFRFWAPEVGARRGLRIWVVAVVASCALNLASAALHGLGPESMDFRWDVHPLTLSFAGGILVAMFLDAGALFEENGWRGFALPVLQDRLGPMKAALLVGLMWAAWHIPVKFGIFLDFGVVRGLLLFAVLTAKFVALSVVIAYFFNRAGQATILAIALHGLSNDSIRIGGDVLGESWATQIRTEADLLLPIAVLAAALAWRTRGRLGASGPWKDATVDTRGLLGIVLRPVRRPGQAGRMAWALSAIVVGPAIALLLLAGGLASVVLAPVGIGAVFACGLLLLARWAGHGDRRLATALLGMPAPALAAPVVPPGRSVWERVRALLSSMSSWRALGWFAVRALLGVALGVVLMVCALTVAALALIPFTDRWLVWGSMVTRSGLAARLRVRSRAARPRQAASSSSGSGPRSLAASLPATRAVRSVAWSASSSGTGRRNSVHAQRPRQRVDTVPPPRATAARAPRD